MSVLEIPQAELTADQMKAISRARFKTTNVIHSHCWILDADIELMQAIGVPFVGVEREQASRPGHISDHQASTGNPLVVAFVAKLVAEGRSKPPYDPSTAPIPF